MSPLSAKERDARALWHDVFGDPEEAVARFFALIYEEEEALVHYTEETATAMLLFPRLGLRAEGGLRLPVGYLCGIATHPAYRGRGLSRALIHEALRAERQRGDVFSTLIPAEPSLFDFYQRKAGFFPAFSEWQSVSRASFLAQPTPPATEESTLIAYLAGQEELDTFPTLLHPARWWRAVLEDYRLSEGYELFTHLGATGKIDGALFAMRATDGALWVRACFGTPAVREQLLAELEGKHPEATFRYYLSTPAEALPRPKGMARLLHLGRLLTAYGRLHPEAHHVFGYRDDLFPEEDGFYELRAGEVTQRPLGPNDVILPPTEILHRLGLSPLHWRAYLLTEGEL